MKPIERIERATEFASCKLGGMKPDELSKPTPCLEFVPRERLVMRTADGPLPMKTTPPGRAPAKLRRVTLRKQASQPDSPN